MKSKTPAKISGIAKAIQQHCASVRIGSDNYRVLLVKPKSTHKGRDYYGLIDFMAETIYVDPKFSDSRVVDTLLHEILHGLVRDRLLRVFSGKALTQFEEPFVTEISTGLIDFFLNNPGVLKVFQQLAGSETK
jgi:hypothetical protein